MQTNYEEKRKELEKHLTKRFGKNIPEFYRVYMKTPDFLETFIAFRDSVMKGGKLSRELKEKIAYLVSVLNECDACKIAHRKHLEEFGCGAEVEAIDNLKFDKFDEKESIALNAAYEVVKNRRISDGTMETLSKKFDEREIIEILSVISLYMFLNTFNNALGLRW